jgi:uncharacterized protein (DUF2147 family)
MTTRSWTRALAIITLAYAPPSAASAAQSIAGTWLTDDGKAHVRIEPCGKAMCGRIVAVLKRAPGDATTDASNPDPAKRANPIEGTYILTGLTDAGSVWKGKIYNPATGKSYNAKVWRNPDGTLKVEGCVAFLCRGPTWQPVR